jgi:transposase
VLEVVGQQISAKVYVALELSAKRWVVGLSDGSKESLNHMPARDLAAFEGLLTRFREKQKLPSDVDVVVVYEAGPDGFSVARALRQRGVRCLIIDSASIEKSRHRRQAKTDNLDAAAMVRLLYRYENGDRRALRLVREPTEAEEDLRELTRERKRLSDKLKAEVASIGSLLKKHGIFLSTAELRKLDVATLTQLVTLDGRPLGPHLQACVQRSISRRDALLAQRTEVEALQRELVRSIDEKARERTEVLAETDRKSVEKVERLMSLKGVGLQGAWVLVNEIFGWRTFRNRKEVGAAAGLTPTPYFSGNSRREQGISKVGNARVRTLIVELAWLWLRHQPESELTRWYQERWNQGGRFRRVGIVAVARRLLIALWRFVEQGVVPAGAQLKA